MLPSDVLLTTFPSPLLCLGCREIRYHGYMKPRPASLLRFLISLFTLYSLNKHEILRTFFTVDIGKYDDTFGDLLSGGEFEVDTTGMILILMCI